MPDDEIEIGEDIEVEVVLDESDNVIGTATDDLGAHAQYAQAATCQGQRHALVPPVTTGDPARGGVAVH